MLSTLLAYAADDPATASLASQGGRAFVSQSLKPYVIAALAQEAPTRPLLVVAGDDRHARDLAADLRTWLAPRAVRFYPSRGVTYESHLAPPPHLVGLRVAALDALLDDEAAAQEHGAPVVVVSAVALSEKVPDPRLRPHGFALARGDLLDLDECAADLVAAGYERVEQVEDRGQFAIRGGLLDVFPATEDHAIRVDLFDVEIESLRWFSTFTQRSLGDVDRVEIAPAAELAAEHRELAEVAAVNDDGRTARRRRAAAGPRLPRDARPRPRRGRPDRRRGGDRARARRPLAGRLRRLPRRRRAPPLHRPGRNRDRARHARARAPLRDRPGPAVPVPRAGGGRRGAQRQGRRAGAREAGALRLPHDRRVRRERRGRARRLQPRPPQGPLGRRLRSRTAPTSRSPRRACATASSRPASDSR